MYVVTGWAEIVSGSLIPCRVPLKCVRLLKCQQEWVATEDHDVTYKTSFHYLSLFYNIFFEDLIRGTWYRVLQNNIGTFVSGGVDVV